MSDIKHYIGLEIECFGSIDRQKLIAAADATKLFHRFDIGDDGSIEPTDPMDADYEIRAMFEQTKVVRAVNFICRELAEKHRAAVNDSCGLHVHIDCRNRDANMVHEKLVKALPNLERLVKQERLDNDYCIPNSSVEPDIFERYRAINYTSYAKFQTVEVRLHHGSVSAAEIVPWVKFLLLVVRSACPKEDYHAPYSVRANKPKEYKMSARMRDMLERKRKLIA